MVLHVAPTRPAVVLIASKQEWASRSLETILSPHGYLVVKTYTCRQTFDRTQQESPDAVIIDAQLPDGDGQALCGALRARELVHPSTPIIMTVPRAPTRRDRLTALRAGAWDCLGQPPDAEELLAILDAFVPAKLDADQARSEGLVDEPTGLYNVRGLTRRAQEMASHATRHHSALACVVLAPDASVSERHDAPRETHPLVVRRIAEVLKSRSRVADAVGRLGPSDFAVIAPYTDDLEARALAHRLAAALLADPDPAPAVPPFRLLGGCCAFSDFRGAGIDSVELMLRATTALRKARSDPAGGWLRLFEEGDPVTLR